MVSLVELSFWVVREFVGGATGAIDAGIIGSVFCTEFDCSVK